MERLDFHFRDQVWRLGDRPLIMGVLNVTPDSFSDGGRFAAVDAAVEHALAMAAAGADLIDIGGESTRPGAAELPVEEEIARVEPVVAALAKRLALPLSIDTRKAAVAHAAIAAGAAIVNDVSGFQHDPELADVVRASGAGYIGMHMRGTPATMQTLTDYDDLPTELAGFFRRLLAYAAAHGIPAERIILDPGIGFGKTADQNLAILNCLPKLRRLGRPLLLGVSRKSFIGKILGIEEPDQRQWGTAAAVAVAVYNGADLVRVHEVAEMRQVARLAAAIREAQTAGDQQA